MCHPDRIAARTQSRRPPTDRLPLRFDLKDVFGVALVTGAVATLVVHKSDEHRDLHTAARAPSHTVSEARQAAVTPVAHPEVVSNVTVFHDFTVSDREGRGLSEHQTVVIRGNRIEWIGPFNAAHVPTGARVFQGYGARYLLPADPETSAVRWPLDVGDPADVLIVSDDPVAHPESLDEPLCVMRDGVVVSLSPSLASDG